VAEGGWLTLAVAAGVMVLFTTWAKGRRLGLEAAAADSLPLRPFVESLALNMPHRVSGTAVFLNPDATAVPHALLHNLKHNQVLHEQVIVLRVLSCDTPRVDARLRIEAEQLMAGIWWSPRGTASWSGPTCRSSSASWPTRRPSPSTR